MRTEKGENGDGKKEGRKECTEESHRGVKKVLRAVEKRRDGWGGGLGSGSRISTGNGNVRGEYRCKKMVRTEKDIACNKYHLTESHSNVEFHHTIRNNQ